MRAWILAFALAASACGNSGGGGPDGSTDAATLPDRWHGCSAEASASSCLPTTPPCPSTFDGGCGIVSGVRTSVGVCDGYLVWASSGKDTTETVYYDSAGTVVAVVNQSIVGQFCVAGPSDFVPPSSCSETLCSSDGG